MADLIRKACIGMLKASNRDERTITHVIHAKAVDRDGEVVLPSGGRFENYRKNPVVFFNHKAGELPIARNINIERAGDMNIATEQFAGMEQMHPAAEAAFKLASSGFLNAWSHGFVPLPGGTADPILPGQTGRTYTNWEELEISLVGLPSLREAVTLVGQKGLVTEQELGMLEQMSRPLTAPPKTFLDGPWNAAEAFSRVADWAEGDEERLNLSLAARLGGKGSLLHHDVKDGKLVLHKRGLVAAMGVLLGARGSVDLPEAERRSAYTHLAEHFEELDLEPPGLPARGTSIAPATWKALEEKWAVKGFSPAAFPIRESWEWVRNMLKATLPAYLSGQGVEIRTDKDNVTVAATFANRAIVGVIGMDRPYEQDKTYQLAWTTDESGVPGWTGTPEEIDVVTHAEIRPVTEAARVAAFQQKAPTSVQTVICSKERFRSADAARTWVKDHDFSTEGMDETETSYRFRQFDPGQCQAGSYATITLTDGVQAGICRKRPTTRAAGTLGRSSDFLAVEAVLGDYGDETPAEGEETKALEVEFREAIIEALGGVEKIGAELSAANLRALTEMCDEMDQHHKGHGGCIDRLKGFIESRRRENRPAPPMDQAVVNHILEEVRGLVEVVGKK